MNDDTVVADMGEGWSGDAQVIVEFSDLSEPVRDYIRALEEATRSAKDALDADHMTKDCYGPVCHGCWTVEDAQKRIRKRLAAVEAAEENLP